MGNDWRQAGFFAAGLAIGAVVTATIVLGPGWPARDPLPAKPAAPQDAAMAFRGAECPLEPAAQVAGPKDGRYRMPAELSGYARTDPRIFIAMGGEAVAAGRPHDAEIAYLMACRVADRFKGAGSAEAADARLELARHYGNLANAAGKASPNCGELLRRAETMYSDSREIYRASHGTDHEKSRLAAQGLAAVRQAVMAQAGSVPMVAAPAPRQQTVMAGSEIPATPPAVAGPARPQARALRIEQAGNRSPQGKVAAARPARPDPACAAARTTADRLICSDAELARLDREVGYLKPRSRNAWMHENEWRRRAAMCSDRACVLRALTDKRSDLLADINNA